MFVSKSQKLEQCLLDISRQVMSESMERENRATVLNRIREITLEAFQRSNQEEVLLLQQELRQQQQTVDRIKRESQEREQALLMDVEQKLHDQQAQQVKELQVVQQLYDEQAELCKKQTLTIERLNKQIKDLNQSNNQLNQELMKQRDGQHYSDTQSKLLSQEIFEYKQKAEQLQSAYSLLEMQFKTLKSDSEKTLKDGQRKLQSQIDQNIQLESEYQQLKSEIEQIKIKRQSETQKYKEALESLKEKSQNKIKEYKQKLKDQQNKDGFIVELQDQIKELEQQIEFQQNQQKQTIKTIEFQYKKQYEKLEQSLEQEKEQIQQNLTKSLESTVTDKDREILQLFAESKQLKSQLQNEQEQKQRTIYKLEETINQLNKQIENQNDELDQHQQQLKNYEQEIAKKDNNLKLLLIDMDDLKQFSEQTLNTLRENQDYMNEIEREKQQQQEIIQNIQHQLEIEIQGSFSYKRLGQELEARCKHYKEEHCSLLEEQMKREAQYQQDIDSRDNKFKQELDTLSKEHQLIVESFENQIKKLKLESKLQIEEQTRAFNQIQKEIVQKNSQTDTLEKQNNQLIGELEQYIGLYTNSLTQLEEAKVKEKGLVEAQNKSQANWNQERHQLVLQLEEQKFKQKSLKQKIIRVFNRYKESLNLQLVEIKQSILSKLKIYDQEARQLIQNSVKKFSQITDAKITQEKHDNEFMLNELQRDMDKKVEQLKKQYKQNEQLIQEEAQLKLNKKLQQMQQTDQSIEELKDQLNYYIQENEHLSQKLQVSDSLNREQQKKFEYEQRQLQQTIQQLQDELYQIQQTADYSIKEKQYFEQRYVDLRDKSEKKMDQIQRDYQQQIQQLETIIQPVQQRAQSPPMHTHQMSQSSGFHRSPIQQTSVSSSKQLYQKPPIYGSPTIRTPHKSPINDRTDKTIEELRAEIQQQKEKLSRMKLNFTESQKKSKTLSKF